jgi:hypothetical protein
MVPAARDVDRARTMTLASAVLLASLAVFLAAFLTWRRRLARRALIVSLVAVVVLAIHSGAEHPWPALLATSASIIAAIPLIVAELRDPALKRKTFSSGIRLRGWAKHEP